MKVGQHWAYLEQPDELLEEVVIRKLRDRVKVDFVHGRHPYSKNSVWAKRKQLISKWEARAPHEARATARYNLVQQEEPLSVEWDAAEFVLVETLPPDLVTFELRGTAILHNIASVGAEAGLTESDLVSGNATIIHTDGSAEIPWLTTERMCVTLAKRNGPRLREAMRLAELHESVRAEERARDVWRDPRRAAFWDGMQRDELRAHKLVRAWIRGSVNSTAPAPNPV